MIYHDQNAQTLPNRAASCGSKGGSLWLCAAVRRMAATASDLAVQGNPRLSEGHQVSPQEARKLRARDPVRGDLLQRSTAV